MLQCFYIVKLKCEVRFSFKQQRFVAAQNEIPVLLIAVENFTVVCFLGSCSGAEDSELTGFGL